MANNTLKFPQDFFLPYFKKDIAGWICICYNAIRQKRYKVPWERRTKSPGRVPAQSRDSSFLFIVVKRPLGCCCPYLSPSSHLMMQWQTTSAATATKKEITASIQTPPPVARYRSDNRISIPHPRARFHIFRHIYTDFIQILPPSSIHGFFTSVSSHFPPFPAFSIHFPFLPKFILFYLFL